MFKSSRLAMFMLKLELFVTFKEIARQSYLLHLYRGYKSEIKHVRTKPARLWAAGHDETWKQFLEKFQWIRTPDGRFVF